MGGGDSKDACVGGVPPEILMMQQQQQFDQQMQAMKAAHDAEKHELKLQNVTQEVTMKAEEKFNKLQAEMAKERLAHEKSLVKAMEANKDLISQMQAKFEQMQKNKAIADPKEYEKAQGRDHKEFIDYVRKMEKPPKLPKASIAILGAAGTGKSTMINKLVGQKVTLSGTSVCTDEFKLVHQGQRTDYYDVPGQDDRYSYYNVDRLQQAQPLHLIIILYIKRVTSVLKIEELIQALDVPYVLVRNQVDADIASEANAEEATMNGVSPQDNMLKNTYAKEKKTIDEEGKKGTVLYCSAASGLGLDELRAFALNLNVDLTVEADIMKS